MAAVPIQPLTAIQVVRALLVADATLVAAVPIARMYPQSYPATPVFPLLVYSALDEFDAGHYDDAGQSEIATVEVQVWQAVDQSCTTIAQHVYRIMRAGGWNSDYAQDFRYGANGQPYKVLRFSQLLAYA